MMPRGKVCSHLVFLDLLASGAGGSYHADEYPALPIYLGFLHDVNIQWRSTNCRLHQKGIHADSLPALAVKAGSIIFGFLLLML
jgi:hypothetical protein